MATSSTTERFNLDESLVESLVREFASSWRTGIQQINDDVLKYFANFRNGMEILKQVWLTH
jgi:vacuolar protein sorting-associated protein 52